MSNNRDTPPESAPSLDRISTPWNTLFQAQAGAQTGAARYALVLRYYGPLRRYVLGILRNESDADDVAQELAVRLMKGNLAGVRPQLGRFRDYLKSAARHAAVDLLRRVRPNPAVEVEPSIGDRALDAEWLTAWRDSVLEYAWAELDAYQRRRPGNLFWSVLRLRTDHPDASSVELAQRLSASAGRTVSDDACRQTLHRARALFANILARIVSDSLEDPVPAEVRGELQELGLWEGCREFLPELAPRPFGEG